MTWKACHQIVFFHMHLFSFYSKMAEKVVDLVTMRIIFIVGKFNWLQIDKPIFEPLKGKRVQNALKEAFEIYTFIFNGA